MTSAALRIARRELGSAIAAAWDFRTGRLPDGLTFARASGGTRINASGVLELVGNNVPRFAYDPVTFAPLGLLIEPQRTNLDTASSEFTDAVQAWVITSGVTVTPNTSTSPDGTTTTDTGSFAAAGYRYRIHTRGSSIAGLTYTLSVWLSSQSKATIGLRLTAAVSWADSASVSCALTSTPTRFAVTRTFTTADTAINYGLDNRAPQGGDGIGGDVRVWGWQLEIGTESTSHIPTSGSAATRAADDLRDPSGISLQAGSILYEVINQSRGGSSPIEVGFGTGSAMYFGPGSVGAPQHFNGISVLLGNNFAVRPVRKMGIAWDAAGRRISGNGGNAVSDTGSVAQVAVPELRFGAYVNGTQPSVICLQRVVKYAQGLSAAELQALTR